MEPCICCNSKNFIKIQDSSYFSLPVFKCQVCGVCITGSNKMDLQNQIKKLYKNDYWDSKNVDLTISSVNKDVNSSFVRTRIKSQIKYCLKFLETRKKLLEIGSGYGINLLELEKCGLLVTGIEPDKRNVKYINQILKNGKCLDGFWETIDLNEKFDILWFSHSFEHLLNPHLSLKKASSLLTKNGVIFIEIPNTQNKKTLEISINENPHIYHFTESSIKNLVTSQGFEILHCDIFVRRRNPKEKFLRFLEKYFGVNLIQAPYHYTKTKKLEYANDIRLILKLKNNLN
jgi:2-polyprenyl-3-methyl-5-hydroxy-6-metoxy-1,4-benzoquinol methylase